MDKQKQKFKELLTSIGYSSEDADEITNGLFVEDGDPKLDIAAIQVQAQEYAKPLVKEDIISDNRATLRSQYANEYEGKIVKASGGKLTRSAIEGKGFDEVLKMYSETVKASVSGNESEHLAMIESLNEQLAAKDTEAANKIAEIQNQYNAEKTHLNNTEGLQRILANKKLTIEQSTAAKAIYRELNDKYHVVYNPAKNDFDLFDKAEPTKQIKTSAGNDFLKGSEEINGIIKTYNWEAVSNGGNAGGGKPPITPNKPNPLQKGKSMLGQTYENEGLYDKAS